MPDRIRRRARRRAGPEIRTEVHVGGNVDGQLAVGSNIVQMRVDRVLGNVVAVLPPGSLPALRERPAPVGLLPRRPVPMYDRTDETEQVVAELVAGRTAAVHGPAGMGKSTLLRHVAHRPDLAAGAGGVVHLTARGRSRDDVVQSLVDAFYISDVPVRLPPAQARHRLQPVRAALLLDDVELPDDALDELADHVPQCGLVVAGARPRPTADRSLELPGLPLDAARPLLERALGRPVAPDEEPAVAELWRIAGGAPGRLVALGASAAAAASLTAYASTAPEPVLDPVPDADARVLGLLAAVPGVALGAEQLAAISGEPDVERRLFGWLARGLVVPADPAPGEPPGPRAYRLAAGVEPDPQAWALDRRGEELAAWFTDWANRHPDALLVEGGSAEPVRLVHDDARRRRRWGAVAVLAALLGVAHAASGHWDAWHAAAESGLEAARAAGDRTAEGLALHQLGTEALLRGDLTGSRELLSAALTLRTALGDPAATAVTRHNLDLIGVPPPPLPPADHGPRHRHPRDRAGVLRRVPTRVWATAALAPLLGGLAVIGATSGRPEVRLQPESLTFAAQAVHLTSGAQTIRLGNGGRAAVHVDGVTVTGRDRAEFTVLDSTCAGPVAPGADCATTVAFTPLVADARQANLVWHLQETADVVTPLAGAGVAAAPATAAVTPASLDFGDQVMNSLGAPRSFRLTAPPSGPVELRPPVLDGRDAADFVITRNGCATAVLRPGRFCTIGVRFAPSARGARSALVTVRDAEGLPVAAVPLAGAGTAAAGTAGVNPAAVAFGDQTLGSAVATRPVTVIARGPVTLARATVTGDAGFSVVGNDCAPRLPGGATCTVTVAYAPTRAGPQTAMLLLDAPGRPAVPLSGSGVPGLPTLPRFDPGAVDFGEQAVGEAGAARTVTLTNTAAAPLRLGHLGIEGDGFQPDAAACLGVDLAPKASCRIRVRFTPTAAGSQSGILSATVQGVPGRAAALLTGTATDRSTAVVPDVVGRSLTAARRAVLAAGLRVGTVTPAPQNGVATGTVVDQTPTAGLVVARDSTVDLQVADGPDRVPVPDVVGLPQADAESRLDAVDLRTGVVSRRTDPSVPAGTVVGSDPAAPAEVDRDSPVDLVVSIGADQVPVPDVLGQPLADAQGEILDSRLVVGTVTPAADDTVPAGSVVASTPRPGDPAAAGSAVDLAVSSGPAPTAVPGCTGLDEPTARARLGDAGLREGAMTSRPDPQFVAGLVVACTPAAGTVLARGTAVDLVVSTGPEQVPVPDVRGASLDVARAALGLARLVPGDVGVAPDDAVPEGLVSGTTPPARELVPVGTPVDVVVSSGPPLTAVPDVVGRTEDEAKVLLDAAFLTVGRTDVVDGPAIKGVVVRVEPVARTPLTRGNPVVLTVGSGMTTMPDVAGMRQDAARAALEKAGLVAGPLVLDPKVEDPDAEIVNYTDPSATVASRTGPPVPRLVAVGSRVAMFQNRIG